MLVEKARRHRIALASALLVVLIWIAFWPLLNAEFINFDDTDFVTLNSRVVGGLTGENISWAFTSTRVYWQPLTWLSYQLDAQLYGLNPRGFHLTNLLLHCVCSLLLFITLRRMTAAFWRSLVVAALFALHPLQVETVAWIAERKGLLSSLFLMLALLAYVRHAERPSWLRFALVALCYALGLMAKSMVITLPALLLLLDVWPLRRVRLMSFVGEPDGDGPFPLQAWHRVILEKLLLLPFAAVSALLTVLAQGQGGNMWTAEQYTLGARFAHVGVSYVAYLRKALIPSDLAVFYPHPLTYPAWLVLLSVVLLASLTGLCLWRFIKAPWLLVGWLWFTGMLLPVIGFLQTGDQAMADRYTYLPLIGVFVALTWGAFDLVIRIRLKPWACGVVGAVAVSLCLLASSFQVRTWQNTRTLFEHALRVTKSNHLAHAVMGTLLTQERKHEAATIHFNQALESKPAYFEGHTAFGNALLADRQYAAAALQYKTALKYNPAYLDALNGLGRLLLQTARPQDALPHLDRSLQIDPHFVPARINHALGLLGAGQGEEAFARLSALLRIQPAVADDLFSLGNHLLAQGKTAEAVPYFQMQLRLQPDSVPALGRLAWILSTHRAAEVRNGKEALRLASRACELTKSSDPLILNSLAAAYAESGNFDEAVLSARRAIGAARSQGNTNLVAILQNLLRSYTANQAHRE